MPLQSTGRYAKVGAQLALERRFIQRIHRHWFRSVVRSGAHGRRRRWRHWRHWRRRRPHRRPLIAVETAIVNRGHDGARGASHRIVQFEIVGRGRTVVHHGSGQLAQRVPVIVVILVVVNVQLRPYVRVREMRVESCSRRRCCRCRRRRLGHLPVLILVIGVHIASYSNIHVHVAVTVAAAVAAAVVAAAATAIAATNAATNAAAETASNTANVTVTVTTAAAAVATTAAAAAAAAVAVS